MLSRAQSFGPATPKSIGIKAKAGFDISKIRNNPKIEIFNFLNNVLILASNLPKNLYSELSKYIPLSN